jgi:phosphoglycerate dehydrogenase-like enzyme
MEPQFDLSVLLTPRAAEYCEERILELAAKYSLSIVVTRYPDTNAATSEVAFFSRELFVGSTLDRYSEQLTRFFSRLEVQPNLTWLHLCSAGIDFPVCTVLRRRKVRLTTSSGAAAPAIAQTAVAGLLAISRGMLRWFRAQARRTWDPAPESLWPVDLKNQTALIVGVGPIGREIGRLLKSIGLRVVAIRRNAAELPPYFDEVHASTELADLAPRAAWLVLACPLTEETRGLVDKQVIDALPFGAGVVNVARGGIVDEKALIQALSSGRLGGAYLDVFSSEPLPPSSPLWDLPNVLISPHSAALSTGNEARHAQIFLSNLDAYLAGQLMTNEIGRLRKIWPN